MVKYNFFIQKLIELFLKQRIAIYAAQNIEKCVIGTGIPHSGEIRDTHMDEIYNIAKNCSGIRRMGSAAIDLAYVASGKLDGFWERNLNIWDVSSGVLLVKESGGIISEPDGNKWEIDSKNILASNSLIHEIMVKNIKI